MKDERDLYKKKKTEKIPLRFTVCRLDTKIEIEMKGSARAINYSDKDF